MNVIQNKLKSKNGASIFMGLMFLLVCVMVGTVVLVASTASAGKLAEQREREQAYLNVSSAAELIKDRICKTKYERTDKKTEESGVVTTANCSVEGGEVILEKELSAFCSILAQDNTDPAALQTELDAVGEKKFEIDLKGGGEAAPEDWETVYGSLKMKADGRILVDLWLGSEDKSLGNNYMKIEFCPDGPVKKTEVVTTDTGVTTKVTMICTWPEGGCTITRG